MLVVAADEIGSAKDDEMRVGGDETIAGDARARCFGGEWRRRDGGLRGTRWLL